jgi:putative ATP-dependent endonuclease of the OLD family
VPKTKGETMRLSTFEVKNYKNLSLASINVDNMTVLIGENNSGKSSVLSALDLYLSGKQLKDKTLFRNGQCDATNAVELTAHFADLTDQEKGAVAVKGRMHNDEWILKKKFWLETEEGEEKWKEAYFSYNEQEVFNNWPENQKSWANFPAEYQPFIEQVKAEVGHARVSSEVIETLKQKIRDNAPQLIMRTRDWVQNPGGGGNWKSNANSIIPEFVFIQAVQEATAETQAKDATTYGKIVSLLIERKLSQREEYRSLYDQLQRVKALFAPNPDHPEWQQAEEIAELENAISDQLSNVISARVKIETTQLNLPSMILPSTTLRVNDGFATQVSEQGHGLQRSLIITLLHVLAQFNRPNDGTGEATMPIRSAIFGVEEPELYLHPQMIRKMKDVLTELSRSPSYQVICPTHSPVFIDVADRHRDIVRFEKQADRVITLFQVNNDIFSGPTASDERSHLRMITEFDPSVNELFFSKRVVLVEGDTEMAVFQRAADLLTLFPNATDKRDVTFINCRGKGSMLLFMQVLNHFRIRYVVVHDVDTPTDDTNTRIAALAASAAPPALVVTFAPHIEGLLGYPASGKEKPIKALNRVNELHANNTLPADFIAKLKAIYGVP